MSTAEVQQGTQRYDPYRDFRFKVKWEGRYVAGVSLVSALERSTDGIEDGSGVDRTALRRSPGQSDHEAITLERGVTHDTEFEEWANKVWDYVNANLTPQTEESDQDVSLADFRKDIVLEVYNEAGQKVVAYNIFRCWVSEFQAFPELDGTANAVSIQALKLENEGWERDASVEEPADPSQRGPSK